MTTERGFADLVQIVRRRWVYVLGGVLICCLLVAAWVAASENEYTATTTILLEGGAGGLGSDRDLSERELEADVGALRSDAVETEVARRLGLSEAPSVEVVARPNSDVVELRVTAADPDDAAQAANEYVAVFAEGRRDRLATLLTRASAALQAPIDEVDQRLAGLDPDDPLRTALADQLVALSDRRNEVLLTLAVNDGAVTVIRPASPPDQPDGVAVPVLIVVALVGGLLIGVSAAFIREFFDRRVGSASDVTRLLGPVVVSTVPRDRRLRRGPLLHPDFASASVDSMREVRVRIEPPAEHRCRVVQFTGVSVGSGSTTIAAHVAVLSAGTGQRVVLVDAVTGVPRLHDVFGVSQAPGLLDVLSSGIGQLESVVQPVRPAGSSAMEVNLVPLGTSSRTAADLLSGPACAALVRELRNRFDLVVFDTEPISSSSSLAISTLVDDVCIVTRAGVDTRTALGGAIDRVRSVGGRGVSVVVNGVRH